MENKKIGGLQKAICVAAMGLALAFSGCKTEKKVISPIQYATAIVKHNYKSSGVTLGINATGIGSMIGYSHSSEEHKTTFVGDVSFDNMMDKTVFFTKSLYDKFKDGEKVKVAYQNVNIQEYEDQDKDGKKELVGQRLIRSNFINAESLE